MLKKEKENLAAEEKALSDWREKLLTNQTMRKNSKVLKILLVSMTT